MQQEASRHIFHNAKIPNYIKGNREILSHYLYFLTLHQITVSVHDNFLYVPPSF